MGNNKIAVVIPSFRVRGQVVDVIRRIGPEADLIYVVDDCCPEASGRYVTENCRDPRVRVLTHEVNQGVGGAVLTGYGQAIADGATVIVKIDGDGQMDPALLPRFAEPILLGEADYVKGNRFFNLEDVRAMPMTRLLGNLGLSFLSKLSTGYWDLFDPTNGYTAIHARVAAMLPREKIAKRYFFETDMLFRLNTLQAVVLDIPMEAIYAGENSSLRIARALPEFFVRHIRNLGKRVFYCYFLRDFSVASMELIASVLLVGFGLLFGAYHWLHSATHGVSTPIGTVMLAALTILLGSQFGLGFLAYDMRRRTERPVHRTLSAPRVAATGGS